MREEKAELEGAVEELDSQHNQAVEQLITQRDELSAKLADCTAQVSSQHVQVDELNELVKQLREEAAAVKSAGEAELRLGFVNYLRKTLKTKNVTLRHAVD